MCASVIFGLFLQDNWDSAALLWFCWVWAGHSAPVGPRRLSSAAADPDRPPTHTHTAAVAQQPPQLEITAGGAQRGPARRVAAVGRRGGGVRLWDGAV